MLIKMIKEYNNVLERIRFCRQPVRNKPRRSDIHRILFMRGQNDDYDEDELYALFCDISAVLQSCSRLLSSTS